MMRQISLVVISRFQRYFGLLERCPHEGDMALPELKAPPVSGFFERLRNIYVGSIPAELGALGELALLDLSTNELHGERRCSVDSNYRRTKKMGRVVTSTAQAHAFSQPVTRE